MHVYYTNKSSLTRLKNYNEAIFSITKEMLIPIMDALKMHFQPKFK